MNDAATVLARPEVQKAISDVITAAGLSYGVKATHAREIADRFIASVQAGQPVTSPLALVDAITKALGVDRDTYDTLVRQAREMDKHLIEARAHGMKNAARMVNQMRDLGITDLRQVRDTLVWAASNVDAEAARYVRPTTPGPDFRAADAQMATLESQRENNGAGEAGGLLNYHP